MEMERIQWNVHFERNVSLLLLHLSHLSVPRLFSCIGYILLSAIML